jgi:hypothetical protein
MDVPRVYADFQKLDDEGRAILICHGTHEDLERLGIQLVEGLAVVLYDDDADDQGNPDDLENDAVVEWCPKLKCWTARFDAAGFRHASERRREGNVR